ncbi:hypothetical protein B0T25DRAFT_515391 [Lasiosphaeria hispida]|uniref:Uncharacterized protein n=1 Tax=Lasiosphaeria hispida TaxID=260671 RepID=A0AAJ0HRC4_9PEZI|nr:hypothetical protein B0T25DRAFT_515391 [Lasiosphaeria hispida]
MSVLAGMPVRPSVSKLPTTKRGNTVLLREGIDIALAYFNNGTRDELPTLTTRARSWSNKYYKGYRYAAKRATGLLQTFPNLFNLGVQPNLRLAPAEMTPPPSPPQPEGDSIRDFRQADRKVMNSEVFPAFTEPILASEAELDDIIDVRPRQPPPGSRAKPNMRVDASMLRGTGLLHSLPEFLGQLARANLETETRLANNPSGSGFELDEETASQQPHVEMDVYTGLIETQKRRHARRVILPGGRPFKLPGDGEEDSDNEGSTARSNRNNSADEEQSSDGDDESSGNESDDSTSTTASLRVSRGKRKAAAVSGSEEAEESSPPNKLRIQYSYPPPVLGAYDMKRRKLVQRLNPADIGPDPFGVFGQHDDPPSPARSDASSSSSSSGGPTRIIRIKVPKSNSGSSNNSSAGSSRASTPENRSATAAVAGTPTRRIIKLKSPRSSPPAASSGHPSPSSSPTSSPVIRIRVKKSTSPAASATNPIPAARPSSESESSSSDPSRKRIRIKLVNRSAEGERPAKRQRSLIQEVEE